MRSGRFREDRRAVPSVLAVVLLIALVIVLSAAVGGFLLDVAERETREVPAVAVEFDRTTATVDGEPVTAVRVAHRGGSVLEEAGISVTVDGRRAWGVDGGDAGGVWDGAGTVDSGDTVTVVAASDALAGGEAYDYDATAETLDAGPETGVGLEPGDRVRVVWTDPDGGKTVVLAETRLG